MNGLQNLKLGVDKFILLCYNKSMEKQHPTGRWDKNMDNVTQNEVIKTRKATPEEMQSFLKIIEKDRNWYSCDNCALRELCDRPYTNKWCDGFRFNLKEEED